MLGEDSFLLRTAFEDLFLRVAPFPERPSPEALELVRRTAFELRIGLEQHDPAVIDVAVRLAQAMRGGDRLAFPPLDRLLESQTLARDLAGQLEDALLSGRIVVELRRFDPLTDQRELPFPELPPLPPAPLEPGDQSFEVRFLDEIGRAISGVDAEFSADGARTVPTNAAGVALLEGVQSTSAAVSLLDPDALARVLDPRWEKFRPGAPTKESNMQEVVFRGGELGPFALKAAVPNTVVIKPPLGKLFVELFDKMGRVHHVKRKYEITGPMSFEGETDEQGSLLHEPVFPGDYTLKLTLEFFDGADKQTDVYETPLVVLDPAAAEPEVRMLGVVPRGVLAQLRLFFNSNKAFLLPTALPAIKKLRQIYLDNTPAELLVVGHADTTGGPDINDPLSLERAKSTIAYLKDDIDAWLAYYDTGVPAKQRWGAAEDRMMLTAMADFVDKPKGQDAIRWFQETRGLEVDGKAGPETRGRLIDEYMALDGASLVEQGIEINATPHGCGENFPLDETGEELDAAPRDEQRDPTDRRVELFFFEPEFGIVPALAGENSAAGSAEYPAWREAVVEIHELSPEDGEGPEITFVELADVLFRTNSCVVLPEGETPSDDGERHESLTSVGVVASALRFCDENERTILVAGHTDTTASIEFNQKLSEERAQTALALLIGGDEQRENWKKSCDARHTVADYKQILAWAARALPNFDCDPGAIDDNASTGVEPVRRFQKAYNANKEALAAPGPDLEPDGDVGPLTWGAIFDCYEFALREELGEDVEGLATLRKSMIFVDDERKALGFSEHFPIEELGVDNFKSEVNRRVEILFFEQGEEPDLEHAENDPETSEIYLPGVYDRRPLEPPATAKRASFTLRLESIDGIGIPDVAFVMTLEDGTERTGRLGPDGTLVVSKLPPDVSYTLEYPDHDDIRAKALAGRLRAALDGRDVERVLAVVTRAPAMFDLVRAAAEQFFPGNGDLIEEIREVVRGTSHEDAVEYCLTGLGLSGDPDRDLVAYNEPRTPAEPGFDGGDVAVV